MSEDMCYYHPKRHAVTRCEGCRRQICAAEINILRKEKTEVVYDEYERWTEKYEYCNRCYPREKDTYETQRLTRTVISAIAFIIIIIFAFSIISNINQTAQPSVDNTPDVVVIGGTTHQVLQSNQQNPSFLPFNFSWVGFVVIIAIIRYRNRKQSNY